MKSENNHVFCANIGEGGDAGGQTGRGGEAGDQGGEGCADDGGGDVVGGDADDDDVAGGGGEEGEGEDGLVPRTLPRHNLGAHFLVDQKKQCSFKLVI